VVLVLIIGAASVYIYGTRKQKKNKNFATFNACMLYDVHIKEHLNTFVNKIIKLNFVG